MRSVYGGVFPARFEYIKQKHGNDGITKIFEKMKEKGYDGPMKPDEFKIAKKYPFEYLLMLFEAIEELYGHEELLKSSRAAAKKGGVIGFFIKWAGSPEMLIKKAGEYWPNFYDFGRLEGEIVNKRTGVLRGYEVSPQPLFCEVLTYYFMGVFDNLKLKEFSVEHTKCVHRGDELCEWTVKW